MGTVQLVRQLKAPWVVVEQGGVGWLWKHCTKLLANSHFACVNPPPPAGDPAWTSMLPACRC